MIASRRAYSTLSAFFILAVGCIQQVHAAGFALIEHSASGMGNSFAGAAAIGEDASTVFFNPAAMILLSQRQVVAGLHYISPTAEFTDTDSRTAGGDLLTGGNGDGGADALVPNFYYVTPLSPDVQFGLGINVPFGLAVKYDDDWVGRYHAVESELETININPSVSFKLTEQMSFGYGINLQSARVILSSAIDFGSICYGILDKAACDSLSVSPQNSDGFGYLEGKDSLSFGWNAGILYQFTEKSRIGFAYRSPISHHIEGQANFTVPDAARSAFIDATGAFVDTGLRAKLRTPETVSLSYVHGFASALTLLTDVTWTGWSNFQELRVVYDNPNQPDSVTTEDWRDSWRYSVGANYQQSKKLMLRCGLAYDETPIPNEQRRTPRVPDNDRTWLSIGAKYAMKESLIFDIGYAHLFISDTSIDNTLESESEVLEPFIAANLNGQYQASVDILSAQLSWNF